MAALVFNPTDESGERHVDIDPGESVLDALLRAGINVPYGCKSGICQSCILQTHDCNVPAIAQLGLRPQQVEQGQFLSCRCLAEADHALSVRSVDLSGQQHEARVIEKSRLNDNVFRLRIEKCTTYHAGQFFTLWKDTHTARSYSAASLHSCDDYIEFHIKHIKGGAFSEWAWQTLLPGDTLQVQGPLGNCYYSGTDRDAPLFLSGIGTGLAPLMGILRDALYHSHRGPIILLVGNNSHHGFYLLDELSELSQRHSNVSVYFIAQEAPTETHKNPQDFDIQQADIYLFAKTCIDSFSGHRIYLCGAPSFVQKMKKLCFINGAKMSDIHADAFLPFNT